MLKSRHARYGLLVLIVLVGALLRAYNLGLQSLWGDEGFTYYALVQADFFAPLIRDVHPPLYFALLRGWTELVGVSEYALRYFSLLWGVAAIALVYVVSVELRHLRPTMPRSVPFIAALLVALADLDIQVTQEARSYTMHIFWIVLGIVGYLRWQRTERWRWLGVMGIGAALSVYTHYLGAFTWVAVGLHAVLFLRGKRRLQAIGALVTAALLFVPWLGLAVLPHQIGKFAGDVVQAEPSTLATLWGMRTSWFTQQSTLMIGLFLLGMIAYRQKRIHWRPFSGTALVVLWFAVPVALAYIANTQLPILYDYRISQITVPIMLLIALGLGNFQLRPRVFLLVVIVLHSLWTVDVYRPKPPWRELGQTVAEYAEPGQAVVMDFKGGDYSLAYYLDRFLPPMVSVESMWQWRMRRPDSYESGLLSYMANHDTVWLAEWTDSDEAFVKLRATGHEQTMRRSIMHWGNELDTYRFDRLPQTSIATFDNDMTVRDAVYQPDDGRLDLWWTATTYFDADYITSAVVLDSNGRLVAQQDSPPQHGTRPTSTWQPDETIYDPKTLTFTEPLQPNQTYRVAVQVYRLTPEGIQQVYLPNGDQFLPVAEIRQTPEDGEITVMDDTP